MPTETSDLSVIDGLRQNIESVIIGKSDVVKLTVTALLARGHLLIEDIPGIGKTVLAQALARSISSSFKRIQFTPDLLPSDITGMSILDSGRKEFVFKPGPLFANIVLADEINRATPRTQSALLEAMNEAQISIDGVTHPLPTPFTVIATQNPIEFTGTYPLPESQLDRFLMVLRMGYPTAEEERRIIQSRRTVDPLHSLKPRTTVEEINRICNRVREVRFDDTLASYVVDIVHRTRNDKSLLSGVSPRGALHLTRTAQAHAMVSGRNYVIPDDIKAVAPHVLPHRVMERRLRGSQNGRQEIHQLIQKILQETPVPE